MSDLSGLDWYNPHGLILSLDSLIQFNHVVPDYPELLGPVTTTIRKHADHDVLVRSEFEDINVFPLREKHQSIADYERCILEQLSQLSCKGSDIIGEIRCRKVFSYKGLFEGCKI